MTAQSIRASGKTAILAALATVTLGLAGWWLTAETFCSRLDACLQIGFVRGELWRVEGERALNENRNDVADTALRRSLVLSPMNSRAWYDLALVTARFDWLNRTSSRAIKMSYYTGFNERALNEPRLALLARVDARSDPEMELLLRRQVRAILSGPPQGRKILDRIYSGASAPNKEIIASEASEAGAGLPDE